MKNKYAEVKINNCDNQLTAVVSYKDEDCLAMNRINQSLRARTGFKAKLTGVKILSCDIVKLNGILIEKSFNEDELKSDKALNDRVIRIIEKQNIFATPKSVERNQQVPRAYITYWLNSFETDEEMLKNFIPSQLGYEEI